MSKSVCFDFAWAQGVAVQCMEMRIQNYFNGSQSCLVQVGIFFSFSWFTWDNCGKDKYFWLVGKQNSETDVCLNVMFVAEAVLTF